MAAPAYAQSLPETDFDAILPKAAPTPDADIMELTRQYLELKRDLDAKMDEWAGL